MSFVETVLNIVLILSTIYTKLIFIVQCMFYQFINSIICGPPVCWEVELRDVVRDVAARVNVEREHDVIDVTFDLSFGDD